MQDGLGPAVAPSAWSAAAANRKATAWARGLRLGLGSLLAAFVVSVTELPLLPASSLLALQGFTGLRFVVFAGGITLTVTLAAAVTLWIAGIASERFATHGRAAAFFIGLAGAAVASPYALWLGRFTFSGPTVRDLALQPLLVAGATLLTAGAFGGFVALYLYRPTGWKAAALAASLAGGGCLTVLLNHGVLPGEYEPLHGCLSAWTCLLLLAMSERAVERLAPPSSPALALTVPVLCLSWAAITLVELPRALDVGWLVAGTTTTTRYLVADLDSWTPAAPASGSTGLDLLHQLASPDVDSVPSLAKRARRAAKPPPNIVLIYIDNVQADRVGALGYRQNPTTPNIDAFARTAATFTQAYSPIPHTRVFMTSLLTGRLSHVTAPQVPDAFVNTSITRLLKQRGYHILVKGWFEMTNLREFSPAKFAIDTFIRPPTPEQDAAAHSWPTVPMAEHLKTIGKHLDEARAGDKPVFIWLHLIHPHYKPKGSLFGGDPAFQFGTSVDALYDSAIASADAWLPKIQALVNSKLPEPQNTYWFISSDHGTGLNRAKSMVGKTVYDDHVRVPLMIAGPDIQTQTVAYPTDTALDASATVLDLAGIAPPDAYDGITLIPLLDGDFQPRGPRPIMVSTLSGQFGVVFGDWKLVWSRGVISLFDRRTDPMERTSVAAQHPVLTESLHGFARATLGRQAAATSTSMR